MEVNEAKWAARARTVECEDEAAVDRGGTRQDDAQGAGRGKLVTVSHRRRTVVHLKDRRVSERWACRLTGFTRSAAWYPLKGRDDA
jgi:hypothetical protein